MATTGEIIWAGVMSSKPSDRTLDESFEGAALEARFPHMVKTIRKFEPLREFYLPSFSLYAGGARIPVSIYLRFFLKERLQTAGSMYVIKLHWSHTVSRSNPGFKYNFRYSPNDVYFDTEVLRDLGDTSSGWMRRKFFIFAPRQWALSPPSINTGVVNPRQILNLSLRSGGIRGGLSFPRSSRPARYTQQSSPPSNPAIRFTQWVEATESSPSNYSQLTVDPGYESFFRQYSSVNTPGFRGMKRTELPENPHSLVLRITNDSPGCDRRKSATAPVYTSYWGKSTSAQAGMTGPAPSHDEAVRNLAIQRIQNGIKDGANSNIALNLAQYGQVSNMVANTAYRIIGSVRSLRRGNISAATSILLRGRRPNGVTKKGNPSPSKALANNWLELQYGWKPLLSDLHGALYSLAQFNVGARGFMTARSSAKVSRKVVTPLFRSITTPQRIGDKVVVTDHGCKFGLEYSLESPLSVFLAQTGFTNPINLAWEILPWSFVADWFIPIGPYLESLSGFHGLVFRRGYQVQFTRQTTFSEIDFTGPIAGTTSSMQQKGRYNQTVVLVDRVPLSGFPSQTFPTFTGKGVTILRAANALALLRQVFSKAF